MDVAIDAARWVVDKALSPLSGGLLETWAASCELGMNIDAIKMELLYAKGMLENAQGREIRSQALKELLQKLQQVAFDADDVLDELDYFRIHDELKGTYEAADVNDASCFRGILVNSRHTAKAVCKSLSCLHTEANHGDPDKPKTEARWRVHMLSKYLPCYSCPLVHENDADDAVESQKWWHKHSACCCSPNPGRDRANEVPMQKFDRVGISMRMKHIVEQLQPICAKVSVILNMEMLGFSKSNTQDSATSQRITISESVEPKLYGRSRMKNQIVHDITKGIYSTKDLSVLSLFGPGGIGKTTLVQYIYKNQEVQSHFQVKIWVCVSFSFNVSMLIQQIKDQIPEVDGEKGSAEDRIEQRLKSKRFLLILDDMWKCDGDDMWKRLLVPFSKGQAKGNMVMVTTRFPALAEMVKTIDHPIELERLEHEEFMHLFEACVFGEGKAPWQDHSELLETGEKIIGKLKGFPLAAKTVDFSHERFKQIPRDVRHLSIIMSGIEEDISVNETFSRDLIIIMKRFKVENLHTLMIFGHYYRSMANTFGDVFRTAKALRVLRLSTMYYPVEHILQRFSTLLHLRYIKLGSEYDKGCLPRCIFKFCKLIILDLKDWKGNTNVPEDMSNLIRLRHFIVSHDEPHSKICEVGKLHKLQELRRFEVKRENSGFELKQLGNLTQLSESLSICNLEKIQVEDEADGVNLLSKNSLKKLTLEWDVQRSDKKPDKEEHTLNVLRPHDNLQELCIRGHGGHSCPPWLGSKLSVKNLQSLHLDTVDWTVFPPLGELWLPNEPGCHNITSLGVMEPLAAVEPTSMPSSSTSRNETELQLYIKMEEVGDEGGFMLFPQHLSISLRVLEIPMNLGLSLMGSLPPEYNSRPVGGLHNLHSLQTFFIRGCPKFLSAYSSSSSYCCPFPSTLDFLRIEDVEDMLTLAPLANLTSLNYLYIENCGRNLRGEGIWTLLTLGRLTCLCVYRSPNFFDNWALWTETESQQRIELPASCKLQTLMTDDIAGVLVAPICTLFSSSLTDFGICRNKVAVSFTREQEEVLKLITSLHKLWFVGNEKLQSLPASLHGLQNLKILEISECPAITSLPSNGFPNTLQKIKVDRGCSEELQHQCILLEGAIEIERSLWSTPQSSLAGAYALHELLCRLLTPGN
uniref:AAA+ ATPase domain-containing protein n=1 Tax=Oryza punctata TaxID=4537 RepID=A0A0E0MEG8_ORYPU